MTTSRQLAIYRKGSKYNDLLVTGARKHGDKWDPSSLEAAPDDIKEAYNHGHRVRIRYDQPHDGGISPFIRTGVVSVTTGWRPSFLLMHRSSDSGSWDLLSAKDRVTHVQQYKGGPYVEN